MKRLMRNAPSCLLTIVTMMLAVVGPNSSAIADARLPSTMDVFTTAEFPIQRIGFIEGTPRAQVTSLTVYRVDGLKTLEQHLNEDLPNDPDQAQRIALQRMQSDGARIRQLAQDGADALELAIRFGIDRYPAIVFNNGESVIYGVTNVEKAVTIYLRERQRL